MKFSRDRLVSKYNSKVNNATQKGLQVTLTLEQYICMYLCHDGLCDYTRLPMSDNVNDVNYVSLERIDSQVGYTPNNVCLIRADVNALKGTIFDVVAKQGFTKHTVDGSRVDAELLVKLCDTIYNPTKMEAIKNKYKLMFDKYKLLGDNHTIEIDEAPTSITQEETTVTQQTINKNPELQYTLMYHTFGSQIEALDVEFGLSYSDYKRMITRKYCQLTDKVLSAETAAVWVVDKTLPVDKNNVLVVDKFVAAGLDMFMVNAKLNLVELKKLCKNLITKGE